jgi:hypothetical protein
MASVVIRRSEFPIRELPLDVIDRIFLFLAAIDEPRILETRSPRVPRFYRIQCWTNVWHLCRMMALDPTTASHPTARYIADGAILARGGLLEYYNQVYNAEYTVLMLLQ